MAIYRNVDGNKELLSAEEEAALTAKWAVNRAASEAAAARVRALNNKKAADIAALGTRQEMRDSIASVNSVPALRALVLKIMEIVYSNEIGTID